MSPNEGPHETKTPPDDLKLLQYRNNSKVYLQDVTFVTPEQPESHADADFLGLHVHQA